MIEARALLRSAVEVRIARISALLRRLDVGLGDRMAIAQIGHAERPARSMPLVGAALVVLRLAEVRQYFLGAPAGVAKLPPVIEVLRLTTNVDEAVDRARTAQHPAARRDDISAVTPGLRLGRVAPVEAPVGEQLAVAERNPKPRMATVRARLKQQHAMPPRRSQPVGQHAAGAARADDDVVVSLHGLISPGVFFWPDLSAKLTPLSCLKCRVGLGRERHHGAAILGLAYAVGGLDSEVAFAGSGDRDGFRARAHLHQHFFDHIRAAL